MNKRIILAEGYPDLCYGDISVCMHKVEWRTEHQKIRWNYRIKPSTQYRLILEEIKRKK